MLQVWEKRANKTRMSRMEERERRRKHIWFIKVCECSRKGDSESDDGDMLSVSSSRDHLMDSWIMDSTCSYHMTPNKDWFDTSKLVNSGYVMIGNDASCRVV